MPRQPRAQLLGYHYIVTIALGGIKFLLSDKDMLLRYIGDSCKIYELTVHTFCIMDDQYHLLLENENENLSLCLRQINSTYALYFNNKYKRRGRVWRDRFKSWYVSDKDYLISIFKYIELNPVKARWAGEYGEYKYTSYYFIKHDNVPEILEDSFLLNNFKTGELAVILNSGFNKGDKENITAVFKRKYKRISHKVPEGKLEPLHYYFENVKDKSIRDKGIIKAFLSGHKQSEIAQYLKLSTPAISRIIKKQKILRVLFEKAKNKNLFWSFSKDVKLEEVGDNLLIETILKYGDFEDIKLLFVIFNRKKLLKVWTNNLIGDKRFEKTNYLLARIFFNIPWDFVLKKSEENVRYKKFRVSAS